MKTNLILLIIPLLLVVACKDDDPEVAPLDQLPPATQTGEYTFGCLVDGEAFVPRTSREITAIYQQGLLLLGADAKIRDSIQGIAMNLKDQTLMEQTYILGNSWERGVEFSGPICRYEYEHLTEGSITITHLDDVEYVISGTFEFTTAMEGCDTVRVTDGRFDIPYIP